MPPRWRLNFSGSPLQKVSESPSSSASPVSSSLPRSPSSPSSSNPISPASSTSSRNGPLAPPPRLHLRTMIYSPPLPKDHLKKAPSIPYPWIWRCHLCHSIYRLGVTRRCLEDGHFFCSQPSPEPSPVSPEDASFLTEYFPSNPQKGVSKEDLQQKVAEKKRERKRKKKIPRGCRAEFDYSGWSKYNAWRREARIIKSEHKRLQRGLLGRERGREIERAEWKSRNCWRDCDFPSECHNERKAEREWERKMREITEWGEKWQAEWDHLPAKEASPEFDLEDLVDEEMEGTGEENLGPLGIDCDGLGEEIKQHEYAKSRRKSMDTAGDSPPCSPLKTCNFTFKFGPGMLDVMDGGAWDCGDGEEKEGVEIWSDA